MDNHIKQIDSSIRMIYTNTTYPSVRLIYINQKKLFENLW